MTDAASPAQLTDAQRAAGLVQAVGLLSGGLDSLLASRLLMEQGFNPTLVAFVTPFFPPEKARRAAAALGLPLKLMDLYDDLLPLVKNPPHGWGRNLNPCVDCHTLMLKKAGELLTADRPGFLYSGEVVGQRPMSQNPRALKIVAEGSGRPDLVLRPLSAQLLPPTEAETRGWVDRARLLGLSGRSRRAQLDLAAGFGLPAPPSAGGCLLTDPGFSRRFQWLLEQPQNRQDPAWPPARLAEIIKRGRLFTVATGPWLVVGRNQADNRGLAELAGPDDGLVRLENLPGPLVLAPGLGAPPGAETLALARSLAAAYGDHGGAAEVLTRAEIGGGEARLEKTAVTAPAAWAHLLHPGR
ncbi:MAG: tRNA 4-thiouridine(8) synthase ThiI [Candidatus Adiutrix sp.]|nr:tRNA 4-thiouridine(8) synthase ThiI [Candidatus Adiutrix sp.]